jgi:hypothetical protein
MLKIPASRDLRSSNLKNSAEMHKFIIEVGYL